MTASVSAWRSSTVPVPWVERLWQTLHWSFTGSPAPVTWCDVMVGFVAKSPDVPVTARRRPMGLLWQVEQAGKVHPEYQPGLSLPWQLSDEQFPVRGPVSPVQ